MRLILILIFLSVQISFATTEAYPPAGKIDTKSGFSFNLLTEYYNIDYKELNNFMEANYLPKIDNNNLYYGVNVKLYGNFIIIDLSFTFNVFKNANSNYFTSYSSRSLNFNFGYNLLSKHKFLLYPYFGIHIYEADLKIATTISSKIDFKNLIDSEDKFLEFANTYNGLNLGLGFAYQNKITFEIKSGFIITHYKEPWTLGNSTIQVTNLPNINYNYYISLSVGCEY